MRVNRLLAGLFALVVTATLGLTVVASADASVQSHHAVVDSRAKARQISITFEANGATSFRLSGKVKPQGKKKAVTLLRSGSLHGTYAVVAHDKANKKGNYAFLGLKTEGYYKARVTASNGYRTSFSQVKHICKGTC